MGDKYPYDWLDASNRANITILAEIIEDICNSNNRGNIDFPYKWERIFFLFEKNKTNLIGFCSFFQNLT